MEQSTVISFSETFDRLTVIAPRLLDSSISRSAIESVGPKSSSLIVKIAESSKIIALLALERLIVAISSFSSIESAIVGIDNVPDVSPAAIIKVPEVAT